MEIRQYTKKLTGNSLEIRNTQRMVADIFDKKHGNIHAKKNCSWFSKLRNLNLQRKISIG